MKNLFSNPIVAGTLFLLFGNPPIVMAGPWADAEAFRAPKAAAKTPVLRSSGVGGALKIELPALRAERLAKAKSRTDAPPIGPLEIGLGREIPTEFSKVLDAGMLAWEAVADGGKLALVTIRSPAALGLRVGLSVYRLPDTAQLSFFALGNAEARVERVTGTEINRSLERDRAQRDTDTEAPLLYWSPIVEGEELGIEIYLPADVATAELRIAVARVSHLYETMVQSSSCPLGVGLRCSEPCNQDVICSVSRVGELIPAVAKMAFTLDSGATAICSGTLINDLDSESQIPYFLSARHCISTQSVASTLQTFWFYQTDSCHGAPAKDFKVVTGGAVLLAALPEVDMALFRLNSPPPDGATLVGWDSNPIPVGEGITGIHHPSGDLKKISRGGLMDIQFCELPTVSLPSFPEGSFFCNPSPELGTFLNVRFSVGTTEGGSSGSGAFAESTNRLVGTLTGGNASCSNQLGVNLYGRFDIAFRNKLNTWLGVTDGCDAEPGSWAFCSNPACGPCDRGQGDCDSSDECKEGLVCTRDAGAKYGFPATADVCELPEEAPAEGACVRNPGGWEYCSDPHCGPCAEGEGDCDADIECAADMICLENAGAARGFDAAVDVCGPAPAGSCPLPDGDWGYCSDPLCGPCIAGSGDCDSDAECSDGLVCASNVGADYGLPATMDVCQLPGERVCAKPVGDWGYCSDPACGPCSDGQADCDSDAECAEGLVCSFNSGERYGLPANMDVCEVP